MEIAVRVEDVSFRYANESTYALQNVSFQVYEGEWVTIVGHNGSGKSTLAKLLIGLLQPSSGAIHICHVQLSEKTVWDVRDQVGIVFQNPDNQFVGTTVQDDVAFGLENRGVVRSEMKKRVNEALRRVRMEDFSDYQPHRLSGGQKQRVAIASALALQPKVIILDEATSMLDPIGKKEVLAIVEELRQTKKMTVISITHDLDEMATADRAIVLHQGKMIMEGTPKQLFSKGVELEKLGLDLPFSVQMSQQLKKKGVPIEGDHLTVEGLVNELWTLYSTMSNIVIK